MSTSAATPRQKQDLILDKGRRRSRRVLMSVPVRVRGKDSNNYEFDEEARTLVANAHGALISLAAAVAPGQQITVSNGAAQHPLHCRVVHVRSDGSGKIQAGIEFAKPSPSFWQLDFAPADWAGPED